MMQTTEPWRRYDAGICGLVLFPSTAGRRPLGESQMRSVLVIIANILTHEAFQMRPVEDDYLVEQIPSAVTDSALLNTVLPRALETGPLGLNAEGLNGRDNFFAKVAARSLY